MKMNDPKTMNDYQLAERLRGIALDYSKVVEARGQLDEDDTAIIGILRRSAERLEKAAGL
jgi:hypothetical protein